MAALREKMLKSKMYRIVLFLILFSMGGGTIVFSPLFRQMQPNPSVMMKINEKEITRKKYDLRLAQEHEYIGMLKQRYGQYAENLLKMLGLDNPQEVTKKTLINQELLNQVANKLHIEPSTEFVMQKLNNPSFVVNELRDVIPLQVLEQNGTINMMALNIWLQRSGQTMADFEQSLEEALSRKLVTDLVASTIFISPKEAENFFIANYLKRKYDILVFPLEKYLKEVRTKPLTDEEVNAFFMQENKTSKRYWIPEERSITYWTFAPDDFGLTVGQKEIEHYYTKHQKEMFLESPVQIKLRHILFKVQEGAASPLVEKKAREVKEQLEKDPTQFEKLAKEHSEDKETAAKGGMLGFVARGDKDQAFWRAALRLQKDNAISDLVYTDKGIEILQRVERKSPTYKPLEKVQKDIEKVLLRQKFKKRFTEDAERVIKDIKDDPSLIDTFIARKKGKKTEVSNMKLSDDTISQRAFKVKQGGWSFLFNKEGNALLLMVNSIEKKHEPALGDVKDKVKEDLYAKKARHELDEALKSAECALKTVSMKDIAQREGLKLIPTDWIKKEDAERLEKLEKEGIPVRQLFFVSDKLGAVSKAEGTTAGYLAQLEALEPLDWVTFKDKKQDVLKELYQEKKDRHIRGFIASLYKNATIKHMQEPSARQEIPINDIF